MPTQITITAEDIMRNPAGAVMMKLIRFDGQLDESNIDAQAHTMYELIDQSDPHAIIVFDFTKLQYLNSKSIGYITDIQQRINTRGGTLVISGAQENIVDILTIVGVTNLVTLYDSLDDVKTAFIPESLLHRQ